MHETGPSNFGDAWIYNVEKESWRNLVDHEGYVRSMSLWFVDDEVVSYSRSRARSPVRLGAF